MTAAARTQEVGRTGAGSVALRPSEGWLSLLALLAMLEVVALAVDDARWAGVTPTGQSETAFLAWLLPLGALWSFLGAKLRWPSYVVHLVGAFIGATVVLVAVASTIPPVKVLGQAVVLDDPFHLLNLGLSVNDFLNDVIVRQTRSDQTSVFLLVVGCVAWASAAFATYAIYRRRRPMSAILLIGLLLLASMSLTIRDQFWYLVAFSVATLLLLVRLSLVEQRGAWQHGRVGEETHVFSLYLRNGTIFIAAALVGALFLTATASSDPLRFMLTGLSDQLVNVGEQLDIGNIGVTGQTRIKTSIGASTIRITGTFASLPTLLGTVTTSDGRGYYLRAATYDSFDGNTWRQSDRVGGAVVPAGSPILAASTDAVAPGAGRREVQLTFTPSQWSDTYLLTPEDPYTASREVQLITAGPQGSVAAVQLTQPAEDGQTYRITALVRVVGPDGVTGNELAAAGIAYPQWAQRYVAIQRGSIGALVTQTTKSLVAALPPGQRDPYHVAVAIQDYLYRDGGFVYSTDVHDLCAPGMSVADCLLTSRHGYCQYFATTMVMMLRTQQIPARYVEGYLPGKPTATSGTYVIQQSAAHAWVEVYFPKFGWVRFDPTPGNFSNGQQATVLPSGPPVATPTPAAGSSPGPSGSPSFVGLDQTEKIGQHLQGGTGGATTGGQGQGGLFPFVLGAIVLLAALVVVLLVRRGRRRALTPDAAYAGVARMAGRFGYGPRASETVYEYAEMLGQAVPAAAPDLRVVAVAKVQSAYGRRPTGGVRMMAVRSSYGRLRVSLLRLAFRFRRRSRR